MNKLYIEEICKKYNIRIYSINLDMSIDVYNDVVLSFKNLTELPLPFGNVSGYFDCGYNNLTSLEHSPKNVGGNFSCDHNNLTSLEHAPKNVGDNFSCFNNKLTSLKSLFFDVNGQSRNIHIGTNIHCSNNPIPIYEYRWWFLGTMKDNIIGGQIHTGNVKLGDFLNKNKSPEAKKLPNLFNELKKFE